MKWFKRIALLVIVLLLAGGLIIYFSLNRVVRSTVQTQTTQTLKLETTLDSANLSLFGGSLRLNGLEIASPSGFAAPRLLSLQQAGVEVKVSQLTNQPIHISNVTVKGPRLFLEQSGGKLNIQAVMDQIPKPDPNAKTVELIIDRLEITDASVVLRPGIPGLAERVLIPLPAITLQNIGTSQGANNGAALSDVVMQVVTTMAAQAAQSDKLPAEVRTLLSLNVQKIGEQLSTELGKQMQALTQDLTKNLPADLKRVVGEKPEAALQQGLQGLLNQKPEKK